MQKYCQSVWYNFTSHYSYRLFRFCSVPLLLIRQAHYQTTRLCFSCILYSSACGEMQRPFFYADGILWKILATVLDYLNWRTRSKAVWWAFLMINKGGHAYLEWHVDVRYAVTDVSQVRWSLNHRNPEICLAAMNRGAHDEANSQGFELFEKNQNLVMFANVTTRHEIVYVEA